MARSVHNAKYDIRKKARALLSLWRVRKTLLLLGTARIMSGGNDRGFFRRFESAYVTSMPPWTSARVRKNYYGFLGAYGAGGQQIMGRSTLLISMGSRWISGRRL